MDDLFSDALRQLLEDQCTPQVVRAIEAAQSGESGESDESGEEGEKPAARLWRHIEDSGFADVLVPEDQGGAGLNLSDAFPLLELCGTYAVPLPLGDTMLARGILAHAGLARPAGSIALSRANRGADGRLVCAVVPAGHLADWILTSQGTQWLLLDTGQAERSQAVSRLDATLSWPWPAGVADDGDAAAPDEVSGHDLLALQACVCAAQLSGALMNVFQRTLDYANERQQFGRPIGKFQASQHQLSVISEHAFAARMAARIGCLAEGIVPDRLRVAVAKARTSEAALEVAGLAHSIHGAIGFTEEFDLQLFTRRLHLWRQAGGSESCWQAILGEELVDARDGLALDLLRELTDI